MMDVREINEEVGKRLDKKLDIEDGKSLLTSITKEELWACTSAAMQPCMSINIIFIHYQ